jgi:DNA invertase Pin-like site-specific DNA recombinase
MNSAQAADIQRTRDIEDRAIALGDERGRLEDTLAANTTAIVELLRDWQGSGIPFDRIASLVGVSRQTLYRWQEVTRRLRSE